MDAPRTDPARPAPAALRRRAAWSGAIALTLVGAALVLPGAVGAREGSALDLYDASAAGAPLTAESRPHRHGVDDDHTTAEAGHDGHDDGHGHGHDHSDPTTKNLVSRGGETAGTTDPTTAAQARRAAAAVAAGRRTPDPVLVDVPLRERRRAVPEDRFAMAGGCYTVGGRPVRFQATDLGRYLLYTRDRRFLVLGGTAAEPSDAAVWAARRLGPGLFQLSAPGGSRTERLRTTTGCAAYPEVQVGVRGLPHGGATSFQEVRGYADLHTHGMAYEFLGGEAHCGKPWDRFGAPYALVDCEDHTLTGGNGAALEALLSGKPSHDPVGWPTFRDWPAPDSLTHEGTYWKWMERSWRGGLRLFVNLLVENGQLCQAYPLKRNSCDEMDSVRLQAKRMREFERYVDAQYGGPGEGWYRIVTSPWQARRVINQGKLAVVMGIETSLPFGCTFKRLPGGDVNACDVASIDRQLDEVHRLGVRQMELVNKFDNALSGVTGDAGETGVVINGANFNETGTFWDMRKCTPADGESADKTQLAAPDISAGQQDALFGAVAELADGLNLGALPLYPTPQHCNARGLTPLGQHLVDRMADKKMLIDPDHMSVKARDMLLDQLAERRYPGLVSSHSWSTPDAYPRIYRAGGAIAPYAGDSTGFVAKWRRHLGWADPRYFFGMSYGADINGLGAQGSPRGADVANPVRYPFRGIGGITLDRQRSGQRLHDVNVDGVAHYGLYPDWVEDLRQVAGKDGDAIVEDMTRGPEAYLQTWERAESIRPDSCRNPGLRRSVRALDRAVRTGMSTRAVLRAVGQPFVRVGREFRYCAEAPGRPKVAMTVELSRAGRVVDVRRG
ncbi:hypothetical protein [Nocardioides perillae]|uniref:Peptidase n=1 Tax=Nocardioides perillae TaxID=1119534 RepID=A0A7Y9RSI3_9ACTN|nr:hypothetical protein [Nocardioides perillae]NYG54481.1 hypothetical protein [Nocardioides perillae]